MPAVPVTRAVPDIRSTNVDKTIGFYTDLLGFDVRRDDDVVAFVSATHAGVEVTLNRDGFSLPPGFTLEVDSVESVESLHERASQAGVRVIEELDAGRARFSVLDPSGRRVTIAAAPAGAPLGVSGDGARPITRAIPGLTTNDLEATRCFYVDYLGFAPPRSNDGVSIFTAAGSGAQVIASTQTSASPDGFDLDVGTVERVDQIYRETDGSWMVLGPPGDFPQHGIRCFTVFDPNGVAVNVAAHLNRGR